MIDVINHWFGYIQDRYQASPLIFGIIYVASIVPCWYGLFKILRAIKQKQPKRLVIWSVLFALFFLAPYAYVYIYGRGYPAWFHAIFGLLVVLSVVFIVKKIHTMIVRNATP